MVRELDAEGETLLPKVPSAPVKEVHDDYVVYRSGGANREIFGSDEVLESFVRASEACGAQVMGVLFETKKKTFYSVDPIDYGTPDELYLCRRLMSFCYFN